MGLGKFAIGGCTQRRAGARVSRRFRCVSDRPLTESEAEAAVASAAEAEAASAVNIQWLLLLQMGVASLHNCLTLVDGGGGGRGCGDVAKRK